MTSDKEKPSLYFPTNRLETLTDGLFAIAMTILVVTIEIPMGPIHTSQLFLQTTGEILPKYVVYFLSFLILAGFWINHHVLFLIKKTNMTLTWINVFWLMFIALVPLSTSLIAQFPQYQLSQLIFDVNILVVGLFAFMIWKYSVDHDLILEKVKPYDPYIKRITLFTPAIVILSMLISFINLKWSLLILFMIPVLFVVALKVWSLRDLKKLILGTKN
nr:TMEM175 family protein [uncultured Methanobacterium sp.]